MSKMTPVVRPPPSVHRRLLTACLLLLTAGGGVVSALDFGYHDGVALETFLRAVSQDYPNITRLHSIGKSINGNDLWVLVIGQNPRTPELLRPNVKYVGNMHGNEVVSRELLLHFVEHLVTSYGQDDDVTRLLDSTTVHLMPTMNPDGFAVANTTDCIGIEGRYNAAQFDLNRNFPDFFQDNDQAIQPETRAIMDWVKDTRFVLSANLHGGSVVANYPFDSYSGVMTESRPSLTQDNDVFVHLAKTYSYAHGTMRTHPPCRDYDTAFPDGITNGAQWYPLKGGMQDYNYVKASCYEITLELSCCKYPPASELQGFWEDNKASLLAFLQQVHIGVKGLVVDENNNSVSDASIVVKGREQVPFTTSARGEYFKLLLPGSYNLLVTKVGYSVKTVPFKVTSNQVTRLDVRLTTDDGSSKGNNPASASTLGLILVALISLRISVL